MLRYLNLAFRVSPLLLAAYWIALFVATHVPQEQLPKEPIFPYADKLAHLIAYALLAIVAAAAWTWRRRLHSREFAILFAGLAGYAVVDELLQLLPSVRRRADPLDWLADAVGTAVGLAVFAAVASAARRRGIKLARQAEASAISP